MSVHFIQFTWYQTDILTPTLGTGQNHPYIGGLLIGHGDGLDDRGGHAGSLGFLREGGATHVGCEFQQYSSKPLRACDFMSLVTS